MSFADAGHRPHAVHTGEAPTNPMHYGPDGIEVTLDTWGPRENLFTTLYDMLQSNWGDAPSRVGRNWDKLTHPIYADPTAPDAPGGVLDNLVTGWARLQPNEQAYVESLFAGRTLPQAKELISFSFTVNGVSRACTHQLVRTRIGAAFMQHGGRDNDWRHRPFRVPETVVRTMEDDIATGTGYREDHSVTDRKGCVTDWKPLAKLLMGWSDESSGQIATLEHAIQHHLLRARELYAALVDAGVPWQDARFFLPDGITTYIHCNYTYAALEGVLGNRLEHIMQWEINCVAQLMLREIKMKCHPLMSKYLGSRSDRQGRDAFAGLESWPPVGKYPNPHEACKVCGANELACGTLIGHTPHKYEPVDTLPRTHRPEQNPFWVLHPDSMEGGPIHWVPTNGVYPKEL